MEQNAHSQMTISEILSLSTDINSLGVHSILEKKWQEDTAAAESKGYSKGVESARNSYSKWDKFIENTVYTFWGTLAVAAVLGVGYWLWFLQARCGDLEKKEIAACTAGQAETCYSGWIRVVDTNGGGNAEPIRAFMYEQAYYNTTGKYLITNPNQRYFTAGMVNVPITNVPAISLPPLQKR